MVENLVKLHPKPPNIYSINTEPMIQGYHFNLASVSESSILTNLKATKVSKAAVWHNLSGRFLNDGAEFLSKPIGDLCNLSIASGKVLGFCKKAKLKSLYKKAL